MALHTYEFYRNRRHDPKWRDSYIKFRNQRIIQGIILFVIIVFVVITVGIFMNFMDEYNLTSSDINFEKMKEFFYYCIDAYKTAYMTIIEKVQGML